MDKQEFREIGKTWLEANKPDDAVAVIIATLQEDIGDSMTDYFASQTTRTVILAWSSHPQDRFKEMRKAADQYEPTAHLGTGKGLFRIVMLEAPEILEGYLERSYIAYKDGERVEYYSTVEEAEQVARATQAEDNENRARLSRKEIEAFCPKLPHGYEIRGSLGIIEHREKYSMGKGFYLARHCYSGWQVRKCQLQYDYNNQIAEAIGRGDHLLNGNITTTQQRSAEPLEPEVKEEPDDNHDQPVAIMNRNTKGGIDVFPMDGAIIPEGIVRQLQAIGYRWSRVRGLHLWVYYSVETWGQTEAILNHDHQEQESDDDQDEVQKLKNLLLEVEAVTHWSIPPSERFKHIQTLISEVL
jgi:hypothetical protein